MRNSTSGPPDLFTSSGLRDPVLGDQSTNTPNVSQTSQDAPSTAPSVVDSSQYTATHNSANTVIPDTEPTSTSAATDNPHANNEGGAEDSSDGDTEMADAKSAFEDFQDEEDASDRDILKRVPNLFRLLDLVDEQGSSGIVEKIVIDQTSLHRLLNTIQPGSYDSVSKINFKTLDKLSIKATGLYGTRPEIVKFLEQAQCLNADAATFLLGEATSSAESPSDLRSGLYLFLRPEADLLENSAKEAYIVYWPEVSTWDDQVASSSVRRNRVTFMRYLTKLAEQIIALVSPEQANAFVWDAGARNKDLPADQMNDDDASRLFSFEVSKSLEQDESATASTGFMVHLDSKHIPKNVEKPDMRLIPGEHKAGCLVSTYEPPSAVPKPFSESIARMRLQNAIKADPAQSQIQLGKLSLDSLMHLASNGLRDKYPVLFQKYDQCIRNANAGRSEMELQDKRRIDEDIQQDKSMIQEEVHHIVRNLYDQVYPSLHVTMNMSHSPEVTAKLHTRYSGLKTAEEDIKKKEKLERVADEEFRTLKSQWVLIHDYLLANPDASEQERTDVINDVLISPSSAESTEPPPKELGSTIINGIVSGARTFAAVLTGNLNEESKPNSKSKSKKEQKPLANPEFISQLGPLQKSTPILEDLTKRIYARLEANLSQLEGKIVPAQVQRITNVERGRQVNNASRARDQNFQYEKNQAFQTLLSELRDAMSVTSPHIIHVDSVERSRGSYGWSNDDSFHWTGRRVISRGARTRYSIYPLDLTEQDNQMCQSDEAYVPKPRMEPRHKIEFTLDEGREAEFVQLVRDKCLAVISERGKTHVYIDDNLSLDQSINKRRGKVILDHHSLGGARCLFALDQATRLLAILHGEKDIKLSVYIFDESFGGLRSRGSPIPLKGWYDAGVRIDKMTFVSGTEEVCFIETSGRARIFSLITQQFRTASLQINSRVIDAFSAPDGSCLFVTTVDRAAEKSYEKLLAFHWASFGSNQSGIQVVDLPPSSSPRVVTRFEGRGRNHILSLSATARGISSEVIQVKQKATEFSFHSDHKNAKAATTETLNNSLVDCHLEVWTRFPVVPAVSRSTLSPVARQPRKLIFQTSAPLPKLSDYFARMISTFELTTRKPMDGSLSLISVFSTANSSASLAGGVSEFLFGSFIVELLCLIPLHLAITRENRFIPLKDGVWDPAYERSLLGADVPAIIDALSLGWYESLFQSYMASKLVRVVSSMGEQSVGKSYCLNHFADTSFAGSAMRTTEGVWLSCTPTESYLLVSLDFEGVHSIERSAQEDALLVLFNTAISNLVLFRNNFALSRDIAGLFTSFQSSAMVLDPNANKSLFNSTLAIIIKDVTNSDANDIVKEFSLKFRQIVEKEQDQNFISRLHRGRIQIIPWPVINSPNFYTLFRHLRQNLDQQTFTHGTGGAFLHNLKTLMAKIKAQDWGALDQNLAAHRAQQLLDRLPYALRHGQTEDGPLKNVDTDEELIGDDTGSILFFVPDLAGGAGPANDTFVEASLQMLIRSCIPASGSRQHMLDSAYLETVQNLVYKGLDRRVDHIRNWVTANVARFPQGNQDVRNLFGKINTAALAMRTTVRICSAKCSGCQLLCLRPYRHMDEEHECGTDHRCVFDCAITEEHAEEEPCALPAGHSGTHMCDVKPHSCGQDCHLSKMGDCARTCVKPPFHDGEHLCSARSHLCGKRCDLQNAGQRGAYSCPGSCSRSWDEPHSHHACDNARACPMECMLCRRLCCDTDHFHGLDRDAIHLCGQEHSCTSLCDAEGICQIETRPSAIQEQFSGRHEAFQYTRYSQVDRRLTCVAPIPAGELTHAGPHTHNTDDDAFHYCDARCPNCEYLCTLPLGHPQQLHETSHGSMTATKWVVEGNDTNPVYELQGRKFGSGDEGAPMLCSLVCAAQGRHAHIDYCRDPDNCDEPECEHIGERMHPEPNRPKDWISHGLWWARSGFKDPYSQEEQLEFSKCDVLCAGPEHEATATAPANPSYCTLPIFHDQQQQQQQPISITGHVSLDGHAFDCQNPSRLHQAYHIVFVIDSSGSMTYSDRKPLPNTPISGRLASSCNNRYGAVLSALYSFWLSRESAAASSSTQMRQDAYSVITFDHSTSTRVANDFASTTNQLINQLIPQTGAGGTNFHQALIQAQLLIETHWSSDRAPVIVFLSDGECNIGENPVYDLCRMCVRLGKALAFYSVSFGSDAYSASLRQMANIAHEVYASAPQDVLSAARGNPCTYTNAIDSIQLADTFLGIARSLQKPRASLIGTSGGRRAVY